MSKDETLERLPTLETKGLRGGVIYYDGQFDDARLAIDMAQTAAALSATVLNYVRVTELTKTNDLVRGLRAVDEETGKEIALEGRVVVNATGPFSDALRAIDDAEARPMIRPSQGVHIVLDRSFLPGDSAIMVPHTDDGRVLFAIPWLDRVVVGTTDTPIEKATYDPAPLPEEIDFLVEHTARYLTKNPSRDDILSAFAGIRPLVSASPEDDTAAISRSGLLTIAGGKWTTYRKMAEDTIDQAALLGALPERPSVTKSLRLHGYHQEAERFGELAAYGADAPSVKDLLRDDPRFDEPLHPALGIRAGEVVWAVRHEMARTVEDFLSRRSRALLLDANAAVEAAPKVTALMAEAMSRSEAWEKTQVDSFTTLARQYLGVSP